MKWTKQNNKDHNYQQLAIQNVLLYMVVTLDTTQLLRSALNSLALKKAVAFGRRKKIRCEIDQIKQQRNHNYMYQKLARQ